MKLTSFPLVLIYLCLLIPTQPSFAQNNRASDFNSVGWYAFFMNYKLDDKWSIHGEFQWRRTDFILDAQQSLFRTGINYKIHPQVTLRGGYAFADTYNYGRVPITSNAIRFPEHRTYQMVTVNNPISSVLFTHRFMLEQRWVGRSQNPTATVIDEYVFLNRFRYMARLSFPLIGKTLDDERLYAVVYDELMIGFGENVNQNIFDQNRLGVLLGHKFSSNIRVEGGYFNQILQFGRLVEGKNLYQYNRGFIINTYLNY